MVCKANFLYSKIKKKQDSEYSFHSFISLRTSFSQTFLLTFINSFFIFYLSFLFSITPTLAGGLLFITCFCCFSLLFGNQPRRYRIFQEWLVLSRLRSLFCVRLFQCTYTLHSSFRSPLKFHVL